MSGAVLDTALMLAAQGFPVFPCGRDKRPALKGGHGFHDASTDPAAIRLMFSRGGLLIGSPTGEATGFDVLDLDYRNGAGEWEAANSPRLPETRIHRTMSGGRHYLFRHAPGVRNNASKVAPGIDVRGDGGYVIMPPSQGYCIEDESEIAEWPDWLLQIVLARPPEPLSPVNGHSHARVSSKQIDAFIDAVLNGVRTAPEGAKHFRLRNAALVIGGIMRQASLAAADAVALLRSALPKTVKDWRTAEKTIEWGIAQGQRRPVVLEGGNRTPTRPGHNGTNARTNARTKPDNRTKSGENDNDHYDTEESGQNRTKPDKTAVPESSPLPLEWFREIEQVLDARDFVQGLLMEQSAAVVYGQSNSGKTFWTTDLALHIAAGHEWHGRRVNQSGVIYCVLEGGNGFKNRVAAWKDARGVGDYDLPFVAIPSALNLLKSDGHTDQLVTAIKFAQSKISVPVRLVVIDTLARALGGGNENAPDDMGALVANMDVIRSQTGATVLFVHHSGKDQAKGARGHSSLQAAIDTEIEVTVSDFGGPRSATVVKQRELRKGDVFQFTLQVVELGQNPHGEMVTTCIVKPAEEVADELGQGGAAALRKLTGHTRRALELLTNAIATYGQSGHVGTPPDFLSIPEDWWREQFYQRAMPAADRDARQRAFRRAADRLVELHLVGLNTGRVWLVYPGVKQ